MMSMNMTRLTNEMRDSILAKIMQGLPNVDYAEQVKALVQATAIEFAPMQVQELYANEDTRNYLNECYVDLRSGNRSGMNYFRIFGLTRELSIQMDERNEAVLKEGTLYHAIYTRLKASDLVAKRKAQDELRDSVRKRLKANLAAATTVKRLFEVLEPELHGFIPVIVESKSNLPACVAPVVEDLKKLGFGAK
jgi:hypothetical protein